MNLESFNALHVANCFIRKAREEDRYLTNLQLMKLVYIAHGLSLAMLDAPLIKEEIQAWRYGPVIPIIYGTFKWYGGGPVTDEAYIVRHDPEVYDRIKKSPHGKSIELVWQACGKKSGISLSAMTHRKGSPWDKVFKKVDYSRIETINPKIPDDSIKQYYQELLSDAA